MAILGPNGAGKTTLMLHLNGVLTATTGSVEIAGTPVSRKSLRDDPHGAWGWCSRTPTISCSCRRSRKTSRSARPTSVCAATSWTPACAKRLDVVSLTEHADRSPAHLSGGQRRRAALATVLACEPEILVFDEPSANLDPVARRELAETLLKIDATMLIVTHDLPYAAQLCDRAVIMDHGVVVADDAIGAVLSDAELLAAHRLELPWGFVVPTP